MYKHRLCMFLSDRVANRSPAFVRAYPWPIGHGVSDGLTWPVLQQATPSEYYFAQQQRPTPPQTSGTFSDAGTDRHHSVDVVTELPTGGSHSYDQLAAATDGFAPGNIIGQGGFGCVYRGMLNGAEVAIKKLKTESRQGDREFRGGGRDHQPRAPPEPCPAGWVLYLLRREAAGLRVCPQQDARLPFAR